MLVSNILLAALLCRFQISATAIALPPNGPQGICVDGDDCHSYLEHGKDWNKRAPPPVEKPPTPPVRPPSPSRPNSPGKNNIPKTNPNAPPVAAPEPQVPKIDIGQMKDQMLFWLARNGQNPKNPWIFWSGFNDGVTVRNFANTFKPMKPNWIRDVLESPELMASKKAYADAGQEWRWWSHASKSVAQIAAENAEKIYVILPKGRPLEKPYADGKYSNFWEYEIAELTRPGDNKIKRIMRVDKEDLGNEKLIWTPGPGWGGQKGKPGDPNVKPT
ncbi:hypothetical protein LOZ53_004985 [Ophidiomyces ophidiicola]|nr:hypothetical protein LOZ55_005908 [Ophidiomyces ophidiicola]KAI1985620.1 hypothetical protein LOZ53_004985 [Ophidiomyces ophidiicola]KAI1995208.1 hypothetical protein LOZ54_000708 [Ophidiomyces ophidiicola]KAI1998733.1 hypothetical protein LOZ51_002469 [Ophidiomyces ophidiicola]